jgi:hypothetical protein
VSLLSILPGALKAIGKVLGLDVFGKAADALGSLSLSPEQQVALQTALATHEEEMQRLSIEELKTVLSENLAMISSSDKYVSRARPTGLYLFYLATFAVVVAEIFGVKIDSTVILATLGPLGGVGGTYVYRRTTEKLNGGGSE